MDESLQALRREARSGDRAARLRLRQAIERAGLGGTAEGLEAGDAVEIRSCLPGPPRAWTGTVRGIGPDGVPMVEAENEFGDRLDDVTGCPRCSVVLLDEPRPGDTKAGKSPTKPKKKKTAPARAGKRKR